MYAVSCVFQKFKFSQCSWQSFNHFKVWCHHPRNRSFNYQYMQIDSLNKKLMNFLPKKWWISYKIIRTKAPNRSIGETDHLTTFYSHIYHICRLFFFFLLSFRLYPCRLIVSFLLWLAKEKKNCSEDTFPICILYKCMCEVVSDRIIGWNETKTKEREAFCTYTVDFLKAY